MTRVKRFFIDRRINQDRKIKVNGEEFHHMANVLRLKLGDIVEVFDGSGMGYLAEIAHIQKKSAELRVKETIQHNSESILNCTIAITS